MVEPEDLTGEQLEEIVRTVQSTLFYDCDIHGNFFWNESKDLSDDPLDYLEYLIHTLSNFGLYPETNGVKCAICHIFFSPESVSICPICQRTVDKDCLSDNKVCVDCAEGEILMAKDCCREFKL